MKRDEVSTKRLLYEAIIAELERRESNIENS